MKTSPRCRRATGNWWPFSAQKAGIYLQRSHALTWSTIVLFVGCLTMAAAIQADEASILWIEGENAARSSTHRNAWFDSVDPAELCGGAQIANFSEMTQPSGWAEYDVDVSTAGDYRFWLRANPSSGLLYAVNGSGWTKLDTDAIAKDDRAKERKKGYVSKAQQQANVAADGTHDARVMTWYDLGAVRLHEGKNTIRFSLGGEQPGTKRFAAIDCFVFTRRSFTPNFQYKPGESPVVSDGIKVEDSWAFAPKPDSFSPKSELDLRYLNEGVAGEHGFIRMSSDGNSFVRGDGQPIRFWGGTTDVQREAHRRNDQAFLLHHARFLAKRGVNIVRLHCELESKQEGSRVTDVDEKELDGIYRAVAAMKKFGIYTIISPYYPNHARLKKSWGLTDAGTTSCSGLLFYDKMLQHGYKAWLRRLYADVNPYTGVPLARDPAVAVIQIQNEDSLLFWTQQSIKGPSYKMLCRLFGDWALKKYGSAAQVREAWKGCQHPDDDLDAGVAGVFIVWELTLDARAKKGDGNGRAGRLANQTEFIGQLMFDFNREIEHYLRNDLGCQQLINAGNWKTADQIVLDDTERLSYTANQVIGKNHYFEGLHKGVNVGWQILKGQTFTSKSFIKNPYNSPLNVRQVVGHPFIIPESLWVPPTRYESEAPLIVAAQSSLTGLDILLWFATSVQEWQAARSPGYKWTFSVPMTLGQFPAAALMFRQSYLREGPAVVHEERSLQDVWERRMPLIAESGAWDPNRDTGPSPSETPINVGVNQLAYLVGRVEVVYGGDPTKNKVADLSSYIDPTNKRVKSISGEIETDLKRGVYRFDSPRAQGVAGRLGDAGMQTLSDVTIVSKNEYACVTAVSLDEKPLSISGRILIQIGTVARPTGWKEKPIRMQTKEGKFLDGARIVDVGGPPWRIEKMRGAIGIKNPSINKATALDANGMPIAEIPIWRKDGEIRISLPSSALYVCLRTVQQ